MNKPVVLVDYGLCNIDSIRRALEECGAAVRVIREASELPAGERIVLPGVGFFATAMDRLRQSGLDRAIRESLQRMTAPFLGICLGMQLMAEHGEEGDADGLGLVPGQVVKLKTTTADERLPHIGWNEVTGRSGAKLFQGIAPGTDFYFVHSYHFRAPDNAVAATTPFCGGFVSAIEQGPVFGVQFHPEKSQKAGFQLLRNYLAV